MSNPKNLPTESDDEEVEVNQDDIVEVYDDLDNGEPVEDMDDMDEDMEEVEFDEMAREEVVDMSSSRFGTGEADHSFFSVALSPLPVDDAYLALAGCQDDQAYVWNTKTGQLVAQLSKHTDSVVSVGWSHPDGKYMATGGMDGKVVVWHGLGHAQFGSVAVELEGPSEVTWLDWHPRGNVLLAGSSDGTVWMWNIPSGTVLQVFSGHNASVTQGQFTPDGKTIVTGCEDGTVIVFDPKTGQALKKLTAEDSRWHPAGVVSMTVSEDSNVLLTGSEDGSARLTHIGHARILASLDHQKDGEGESVEAVAFVNAPGLHICITGSLDGSIKLWDTSTMRIRHNIAEAHPGGVIKIVSSKTEPFAVSCGNDGVVKVWDVRSGQMLKEFTGHQDIVLDVDLSRDGKVILTGSDDGYSLTFSLQ